ncbi:MAG: sulfate transporter permease subunit CysT [Actinomycetia bacterium]|nr:sulfate transporter permease subunit CysT [Actinomycetes bacterium]
MPPAPRPGSAPGQRTRAGAGTALGLGFATLYMSIIVLLPLSAIVWKAHQAGWSGFWADVTTPEAWSTMKLTILLSIAVALTNIVMGTLIAWVLVRDSFPGKRVMDVLIDLPFALPTIVAGLVLLTLYGPTSPIHVTLAYTRPGVFVALLFVTLPFCVRTVQPVLIELDRDMEEAAASLGASRITIFRRIVLPNLMPAILAGGALSFARALSEYGSTVLISGNIPFKTQVASVHIFNQIENDNVTGAAAVATVLLGVSLIVLLAIGVIQRWSVRR